MTPQPNRVAADQGFTVLEVSIVVLIIGILLAMAVATFVATTGAANAAACRGNQDALAKALVISTSTGNTVDEIGDLEPYVKNFDEISLCPKDGTPLILDVAHNEVTCPNHP